MLRYRLRRSHWLAAELMFLWVPDPDRSGQLIDLIGGRRTRTASGYQTPAWRPAGAFNGMDLPCVDFNRAVPHGVEYPNSAARGADPIDSWLALNSGSATALVARPTALASAWQGVAVKNRDIIGNSVMGYFISPANLYLVHSSSVSFNVNEWHCGAGAYHDGTSRRTTGTGSAVTTTAHSTSGSGTGAFRFGYATTGENFSGQIALHAGWIRREFTNSALQQIAGHTLDKGLSSITDLVEVVRGPAYAYGALAVAATEGGGAAGGSTYVPPTPSGVKEIRFRDSIRTRYRW